MKNWPSLLYLISGICSAVAYLPFAQAESEYYGLLDFRFANSEIAGSSQKGYLAPFRIDESDSDVYLGQAILFSRLQLGEMSELVSQFSAYNDEGEGLGVGEFYFKFDPQFLDNTDFELKVGAFFPEISLENIGPGWTARNPLSNSVINTWIGEEIRIVGIQPAIIFKPTFFNSEWNLGVSVAATTNNDPAGAMLSWRGWSLHDRQTRIDEKLPISDLPILVSDTGFIDQASSYQPIVEVDSRIGFTHSLYLKKPGGLNIRWYRYDNRADPKKLKQGQYGWHTRFDHLGLALPLNTKTRLNAQWISGDSLMGDRAALFVNTEFTAWHIGVTQKIQKFYLDLRIEKFEVVDLDGIVEDDNAQQGKAGIIGLRYDINNSLALLGEYVSWEDEKNARLDLDLPLELKTQLSQISLQWRF